MHHHGCCYFSFLFLSASYAAEASRSGRVYGAVPANLMYTRDAYAAT